MTLWLARYTLAPNMADPERRQSPSPENPKGGIEIVISNMDLFYEHVRTKREGLGRGTHNGYEKVIIPISKTHIGDPLFESEETSLVFMKSQFGNYFEDVGFITKLVHSNQRLSNGNLGYYNEGKEASIHKIINSKNTQISFEYNTFNKGRGSMLFDLMEEAYIRLKLGDYNRETFREKALKGWKEKNEPPQKGKLSEKEYRTKANAYQEKLEGFEKSLLTCKNETICIDGTTFGFKMPNEDAFIKSVTSYAEAYKAILESIYEAENFPIPNLKINFGFPEVVEEVSQKDVVGVKTEKSESNEKNQRNYDWDGFEAVAGQEEAVTEAKKLVAAIKNPEIYKKRGVKIPKGILLYGPPGTGKTMLAKAIAKESGAEFMEFSVADINSKWHGESEQKMQEIFDNAGRSGKKTILFFDEFDSLAPAREDAYEISRKVLAVFNQNMDGIRSNSNVIVIAATNRPEGVDLAAKRSGRFDKMIEMPLPNTDGRIAILKKQMEKAAKESDDPGSLFSKNLDLNKISEVANGMSGADLANLINQTLETKLSQELEGKAWSPIRTDELLDTAYKLSVGRSEKVAVDFSKKQK